MPREAVTGDFQAALSFCVLPPYFLWMRTLSGLNGLRELPPGTALSIGNFDGIHRGHKLILQKCRDLAGAGNVALVTFEPHPLTVLRPELAPPRLTPISLKQRILEQNGVDFLVVLAPEPSVLNLTAEDFWRLLRDEVRPAFIVEGPEFIFGRGRGGTIDKLREWSAGSAVQLRTVDPLRVALSDLSVVHISSSLIRWLLTYGRVRDAAICLGHPYVLEGTVIEGFRRGRKMGIPTANLRSLDQLVPSDGVYVARCTLDGRTYPAALSIGTLPTFHEARLQIEAHLIGFDGDIYGRVIQLELIDWIRDQVKFAGVEDLKDRMARDIRWTAERAGMDASKPLVSV